MKKLFIFLFFVFFTKISYSQVKETEIHFNDSITLIVGVSNFRLNDHVIDKNNVCDPYYLIDDTLVFGTDGDIPYTKLNFLKLKVNNKIIILNSSSMYNTCGKSLSPSKDQFNILILSKNCMILNGNFSDGAGFYNAEWLIIKGKSTRTKLFEPE